MIRRVDVCQTLTVSERVGACHDFSIERTFNRVTFEEFAGSEGVRLRAALVAA